VLYTSSTGKEMEFDVNVLENIIFQKMGQGRKGKEHYTGTDIMATGSTL